MGKRRLAGDLRPYDTGKSPRAGAHATRHIRCDNMAAFSLDHGTLLDVLAQPRKPHYFGLFGSTTRGGWFRWICLTFARFLS